MSKIQVHELTELLDLLDELALSQPRGTAHVCGQAEELIQGIDRELRPYARTWFLRALRCRE
jgi:hypothetical protein